jgi:pyrroloquinoline quinone biosynthesis protein E
MPNVKDHSLEWIWQESPLFQAFRGDAWMKEPCVSCERKCVDFGGCRCQAFALTGDAANADPICHLSPHHHLIADALGQAGRDVPFTYRAIAPEPQTA